MTSIDSVTREELRETLVAIDYAMEHGERLVVNGKAMLAIPACYQDAIRTWCGDALEQLGCQRNGLE